MRDCICGNKPAEQTLLVIGFGLVPLLKCGTCGASSSPALTLSMARESWNDQVAKKSSAIIRASKRQMAKGAKK